MSLVISDLTQAVPDFAASANDMGSTPELVLDDRFGRWGSTGLSPDLHVGTMVDHLGTVSLEELVGTSELLTRRDRKYLIPTKDLPTILGCFEDGSRVLQIGSLREFAYESVYFDTPDRLSYRMAVHQRRRRFKVRTRSYMEVGSTYLELKTKGTRGMTVKNRCEYDLSDRRELTLEGSLYLARLLDEYSYEPSIVTELVPTLMTQYHRVTVLLPEGGRVSVDSSLQWRTPEGRSMNLEAFSIVESKSSGSASGFDRCLWGLGYRPSRFSKYGTGMAGFHPELPRNKWNRTLRLINAESHTHGAEHEFTWRELL